MFISKVPQRFQDLAMAWPHNACIEVGVDVGPAPNAQMFVFRDLGHVGIQVLCSHLCGDLSSTELDVAVLDAMSISVRHEASKGVWISHHLAGLITSCRHGRAGLQGSSRSGP